MVSGDIEFTLHSHKPTYDSKCRFLGWSTDKNATTGTYQPGQTIKVKGDTTLYAIWDSTHNPNADDGDHTTPITCKDCGVVTTAATGHNGTKQNHINNGSDHTYTWSCCGKSFTESHSYSDCVCACGAENHTFDAKGFCTKNANHYKPAELVSGVYQIESAGNLFWFAQQVNNDIYNTDGDKTFITAKAILTADIDLEGRKWTPIGALRSTTDTVGNHFAGTFDGNHKTISGLNVQATTPDSGFFGEIRGAEVKNFTISGTISVMANGIGYIGTIGAICGETDTLRTGESIVSGITSHVDIVLGEGVSFTKLEHIGGIAGYTNQKPTIENCVWDGTINIGTVNATNVGGIVGLIRDNSTTIRNCGTYGEVTSGGSWGGILGNAQAGTSTIENCFTTASEVRGTENGFVTVNNSFSGTDYDAAPAGEIAYDLGAAWGQNLSTDQYPILGGAKVYYGYISCADDAQMVYTNTEASAEKPAHTAELTYQDNGDGTHTATRSCCSTVVENHTYHEITMVCLCGAVDPDAVATVSKNGTVIGGYTTLDDAINAVKSCTASDNATVTLLKNIDVGTQQNIISGVFTFDLNSKTLTGTSYGLLILGDSTNVTITDSGTGGTVSGGVVVSSGGTVTITGGTITAESYGVYVSDGSTVTITGGTVSGGIYDLCKSSSATSGGFTLTLAEGKTEGTAFPGGIVVDGTTLAAILGDGATYCQNGKLITITAGQTSITGGDVVIKAACDHIVGTNGYTHDETTHSFTCNLCETEVTENHKADPVTGKCVCGAEGAVASVTIGETTTYYDTLNAAIQAVANCTAADNATVKLQKNVNVGLWQDITSGVFTFDLNGKILTSSNSGLYIRGDSTNVTVTDSGTGGTISSGSTAVHASSGGTVIITGGTIIAKDGVFSNDGSKMTITGGTITAESYGADASNGSTMTITGGTITAKDYGVYAGDGCEVTITGGTVTAEYYGVFVNDGSTVTITGGTVSGGIYDLCKSSSATSDGFTLTLAEGKTEGAAFPGGIVVDGTTLAAILGDGMAYWQGDTMIVLADGQTSITGGDVVIKAACDHAENTNTNYTPNSDDTHSFTCNLCKAEVTENHKADSVTGKCVCGAVYSDTVATLSMNGTVIGEYTTLDDAIQAVANCTAADNATVTLLKNVDVGDVQYITSGVFTFDLNGKTLTGTSYGLRIHGDSTNVTITDSGTGGTVRGNTGVRTDEGSEVTITGGTITAESYGVDVCNGSTVTITGGTITGAIDNLYLYDATITLTLAEGKTEGATFPGGIVVGGTTLAAILGDGVVYWQGDRKIVPTNVQTSITGGDVVIKAACIHDSSIDFDDNGFCPNGCYEPTELNESGYYEIGNAGQFFWFAEMINSRTDTTTPINAVLTGNIDLEGREWTPVGAEGAPYSGLFDGNGYRISNLSISKASAYVGLFGNIEGAGIRNLTVSADISATWNSTMDCGILVGRMKDSILYKCYVSGNIDISCSESGSTVFIRVGGLAGNAQHCVILNCGSDADVIGNTYNVGGLVGYLTAGYDEPPCLLNSYCTGNVTAAAPSNYAAGLVGYLSDDVVNNYFSGPFPGTASTAGVLFGYIDNSINVDGSTTTFTPVIEKNYYISGNAIGSAVSGLNTEGYAETYSDTDDLLAKLNSNLSTVEEIIAGHLGYLQESQWAELVKLLDGESVMASHWRKLDGAVVHCTGSIDWAPDASGTTHSGICSSCGATVTEAHSYDNGFCTDCGASCKHSYDNGFCTDCGAYEPAKLVNGVYQIGNAGQLYWFADKVASDNATYGSADAILSDDIVVNKNVLQLDGTLNEGEFRGWTPIGSNSAKYTGTFDGDGHTVSGLYFNNDSTKYVGLFGYVDEGGTVQNVGVVDSYFCGSSNVGGVVGYMRKVSVMNCYNTGTVSGRSDVGGVVGLNSGGTVMDCYNTGTVSSGDSVGGVVAYNSGAVINCYNTGSVSSSGDSVGGVVGLNYGTVTNCYNTGTVSGTIINIDSTVGGSERVGGVVGYNYTGIVTNCYSTGTVSGYNDVAGVVGANTGTVTNCYFDSTKYTGDAIGYNSGTTTDVAPMDDTQFASGEVAWLLSQGCTVGEGDAAVTYPGDIWGQTIGTEDYPTLGGEKVYFDENADPQYYNEKAVIISVIISKGNTAQYTVDGQTVTVTHDKPCAVGYLDKASGKYIAITAVADQTGSYRFTAPKGVTEVLIALKGDVNRDGKITAPDVARMNAQIKGKTTLTAEELFAADVTGDGQVNNDDIPYLNNAILGKRGSSLTW